MSARVIALLLAVFSKGLWGNWLWFLGRICRVQIDLNWLLLASSALQYETLPKNHKGRDFQDYLTIKVTFGDVFVLHGPFWLTAPDESQSPETYNCRCGPNKALNQIQGNEKWRCSNLAKKRKIYNFIEMDHILWLCNCWNNTIHHLAQQWWHLVIICFESSTSRIIIVYNNTINFPSQAVGLVQNKEALNYSGNATRFKPETTVQASNAHRHPAS